MLGEFIIRNALLLSGMRRVTLEFNYEDAWRQIFGPNSPKVEVLEALRCFKCDAQGIAIICRIKLKDRRIGIRDLAGKGLITNIEVLFKEKDGSHVVFIEGRACIPAPPKNFPPTKLLTARPPEFLDVNRMKAEVIGRNADIKNLLKYASKSSSYKILGLTSVDTASGSPLSTLTSRQRQILLTAFTLGYYDVPRKISSEDLSRHLNADKSTIVEHLRKAERKVIGGVIAG